MEYFNQKTRISASTFSVILGLAGFLNHGIFEVLQGNKSTNGFFIEAIGESHRYWVHGTEGAFTIIPNFLLTGIFTIFISLAIILWSLKYIQMKNGASVLLLLFILLTAFGGGLGHIIFFVPVWAYATRINKPLQWWQKILPERSRKIFSHLWIYALTATVILWLMVMALGIFGYFPGQSDPDNILNIVFILVLGTVLCANITFISAFAADLESRIL